MEEEEEEEEESVSTDQYDTEQAAANLDPGLNRRQFVTRTSVALAGATTLSSLFLEACGGGSARSRTSAVGGGALKPAKSLGVRSPGALPYLDVVQGFDPHSYNVLRNGVEPLLKIDAQGSLHPGLAASFRQPDPLTLIYALREDVEFWDGSKLTPEDVIFSIKRSAGSKSLVSYYWSSLKSATKTGPMEVTVKLTQPTAFQPFIPAYVGLLVVSKRFAEKLGPKFGTPGGGTMGTGPYIMDSQWNADEGITMHANPNYWDKANRALITTVHFSVITDPSAGLTAAQSGQTQAYLDPGPQETVQYSDVGFRPVVAPGLANVLFGFNVMTAPFDDIHVRRAFAHCIDRNGLANGPFKRGMKAATVLNTPSQWAGMLSLAQAIRRSAQTMQYPFSIADAKRELAQSKHPKGFSVELPVDPNRPFVLQTAQDTAANLKEIGINMTIKTITDDVYNTNQSDHGVPIQIVRYTADNNDPLNTQYYVCFGKYAVKGQTNFANYKSAKMDRLLTAYDSAPIGPEKLRLALAVNALIQIDLPYAAVGWVEATMLLQKGFGIKRWDGYTDTFGPLFNLVGKV